MSNLQTLGRYLGYCNPVNLTKEKKRFFSSLEKGIQYNPVFDYRELNFDKRILKKEIRELYKSTGRFREILEDSAKRYEIILKMLEQRGKNFTHYSRLIFPAPTRSEIKTARDILRGVKRKKTAKYYNAETTAEKLKEHAGRYGWEVHVGRSISKMKTVPSKRRLVISENAMFSNEELRRLRWHEIETHIRREFNNRKLPKEIRNHFNYIETEEGLAVKMEELHGCREQLPVYAARLLAVDSAQRKSFFEVYMMLTKWLHSEAAFMIAARAKRGMVDTSKPGGLTRDKIYLSGKIKVERFLRKGKMKDLFLGKIGVEDVKFVKSI